MSDSKEIVKQKFIEHFLFDYTDKDEFEIQMLSEIFEGIYYQKDKHFKPESKYWQVFRCLQDQQVEINQHQLEIHALGEANLNQAMMLAKKQEEIDNLKAQLSLQRDRNKALETELTSSRNYGDGLQKRINELERGLNEVGYDSGCECCMLNQVDVRQALRGERE